MCLCKLFIFVNLLLVASGRVVSPCLTPNQETAFCISLFSCPVLMKSLGTLKSSSIEFIKQSICTITNSEEFPVCCGSSGDFQRPNIIYLNVTLIQPIYVNLVSNGTFVSEDHVLEPKKPLAFSKPSQFEPSKPLEFLNSSKPLEGFKPSTTLLSSKPLVFSKPLQPATSSELSKPVEPFKPLESRQPLSEPSTTVSSNEPLVSSKPSQSVPPPELSKPSESSSSDHAGSSNLSDSAKPSPLKPEVLKHRNFVKTKLLPTRKYCGLQHTDDRIYEENATALDEYPWVVHLTIIPDEDEDPLQFLIRCNGVLINRRYVLTSSFCGVASISVRLGQYYTNQTISCVDNPDFDECTEPWLVVEVEERIQRDNYTSNFTVHDFALLRLTKKVTYTDYARPICLPLDQPKEPPEFYTFSGWGTTENIAGYKKRLRYKPTNLSECYTLDLQEEHQIDQQGRAFYKASKDLTPFCLLPKDENGELACSGDEASPIMYPRRFQWFADGIITRIYYPLNYDVENRCSNKLPVAGLKITPDILDWMFDNMRR